MRSPSAQNLIHMCKQTLFSTLYHNFSFTCSVYKQREVSTIVVVLVGFRLCLQAVNINIANSCKLGSCLIYLL